MPEIDPALAPPVTCSARCALCRPDLGADGRHPAGRGYSAAQHRPAPEEGANQRPSALAYEYYSWRGRNWEGEVELTRAVILEARGQFREAEASYAKARILEDRKAIPDYKDQEARGSGIATAAGRGPELLMWRG